jgi:hypothetical protein
MEIYLDPQLLSPPTASPFSVQRGTQPLAPGCWSPADPACLEDELVLAGWMMYCLRTSWFFEMSSGVRRGAAQVKSELGFGGGGDRRD